MALSFYTLVAYFFIYSFLGWTMETIYASVKQQRYVNRGFLNGPFCPIYGSAAVLLLLALTPLASNPVLLFIVGAVLASALEYFTGYIMETIFHAKWWDYSQNKFNLDGRICLKYTFLWGILSALLVEFIHPAISRLIERCPAEWLRSGIWVLLLYFIADCGLTVWNITTLHQWLTNLQKLSEAVARQKEKLESLKENLGLLIEEKQQNIRERLEEELQSLSNRYEQLLNKPRASIRLLKAFPGVTSKRFAAPLSDIKDKLLSQYVKYTSKTYNYIKVKRATKAKTGKSRISQ